MTATAALFSAPSPLPAPHSSSPLSSEAPSRPHDAPALYPQTGISAFPTKHPYKPHSRPYPSAFPLPPHAISSSASSLGSQVHSPLAPVPTAHSRSLHTQITLPHQALQAKQISVISSSFTVIKKRILAAASRRPAAITFPITRDLRKDYASSSERTREIFPENTRDFFTFRRGLLSPAVQTTPHCRLSIGKSRLSTIFDKGGFLPARLLSFSLKLH